MQSPGTIDAVVFDMGGVFVVPNPVTLSAALLDAGIDHELHPSNAGTAHYVGVRAITDVLSSQVVDERDLEVWSHYDNASFASAGLEGHDLAVALEVRAGIRRGPGPEDVWTHVLPANVEAFARIAKNLPVAIVTNNNGTAVQQCLDHGICQLDDGPLPRVAAIVDSSVVQISKPDPRIFTPAIEALGTEAARTLYVGDTVHADVHGARAAGMPVVQLDPLELHADHDHWRLPDVGALADYLLS